MPADVTVRSVVRDGFRDVEAIIGLDRLARIAAAGRLPGELHATLGEYARYLVIGLVTMIEDMRVQRTRAQLRHELVDLLRELRGSTELPAVPHWLRSEIEDYAHRARLDLPFGSAPTILMHEVEAWISKSDAVRAEVSAAFSDAEKLAGLVQEVLQFFKRSPPFTREYFASKSSFRPELEIVFRWVEGFWFGRLRRELIMSSELNAFAIEVFKMCGVAIPGLSLERRLQAMIRAAAKRAR